MNYKKETICAVVVTYNRNQLLLECLESLRKQTKPIDAIYLIDNASTDGTPEILKENEYITELPPNNLNEPLEKEYEITNLTDGKPIKFHYVRMHENTGGAGGFYEGVKRGYEKGYDWLWLMDDDTVPKIDALEELYKKRLIYDVNQIGFLCSKVLWTDDKPHLMNVPSIKPVINGVPFNCYEDDGILLVESVSFVSLLLNRIVIERVGLPIKDFFIWADDVEYTLRITKQNLFGIYVHSSQVYHKTKQNYSAANAAGIRKFYNLRNWLWVFKLHNKKKYIAYLFYILFSNIFNKDSLIAIKAVIVSLVKTPKIEKLNLGVKIKR